VKIVLFMVFLFQSFLFGEFRIPDNYIKVDAEIGIDLYKDKHRTQTYMQVVDFNSGGRIKVHANEKNNEGNFKALTPEQIYKDKMNLFSVINGTVFLDSQQDEYKSIPESFISNSSYVQGTCKKKNGEGEGFCHTFGGTPIILKVMDSNKVEMQIEVDNDKDKKLSDFTNKNVTDAIVGQFVNTQNAYGGTKDSRTAIGLADKNGDGQGDTLLILTYSSNGFGEGISYGKIGNIFTNFGVMQTDIDGCKLKNTKPQINTFLRKRA